MVSEDSESYFLMNILDKQESHYHGKPGGEKTVLLSIVFDLE